MILCEDCSEEEHESCSLDPYCACCQNTIQTLIDQGDI